MPKRTRDYHSWRLEKLADAEIAGGYLNDALADSPEMFLKALLNVVQARQVAAIAKEAGIQRETLYRAFSDQGNPTLETLHSVLNALGLKIEITAKNEAPSPSVPSAARQPKTIQRQQAKKKAGNYDRRRARSQKISRQRKAS